MRRRDQVSRQSNYTYAFYVVFWMDNFIFKQFTTNAYFDAKRPEITQILTDETMFRNFREFIISCTVKKQYTWVTYFYRVYLSKRRVSDRHLD